MPTLPEWEDSLRSLGDEEVMKIEDALNTLYLWELFNKTYPELAILRRVVEFDTSRRMAKYETCKHDNYKTTYTLKPVAPGMSFKAIKHCLDCKKEALVGSEDWR